jgi:hypothetical protein
MGEGMTMTDLLDSQPTGPAAPLPPPGPTSMPARPRRTPSGVRFLWKLFAAILVLGTITWVPYQVVTLLAHEERVEEQSFPAAGLTTLQVDGSSGSITITGSDTDSIHVRAEISDGLRPTGESRRVVGDTLQLHSTCPNYGSDWCHVNYEVSVPRDIAVVVNSGDGSVDLSGTTGPVNIDTDNGSLDIADVSGDVHVASDNGRITAARLRSQTVTAGTDNGRLTLEFAAAPTTVVATADNGRVTVVVPNDGTAYRVETETDNGSENVSVPTDGASTRTITARTDNGSVTIRPAT